MWGLPRVPEPERRGSSLRALPPHIPEAPFLPRVTTSCSALHRARPPPTPGAAHPFVRRGRPALRLAMKSELVFQAMDFPRATWGVSKSVKTEQRPRGAPPRCPSRLSAAGLAARSEATPLSPVLAPGTPPSQGSASDRCRPRWPQGPAIPTSAAPTLTSSGPMHGPAAPWASVFMSLFFHLDFVTDETMMLSYTRSDHASRQASGSLPGPGLHSQPPAAGEAGHLARTSRQPTHGRKHRPVPRWGN